MYPKNPPGSSVAKMVSAWAAPPSDTAAAAARVWVRRASERGLREALSRVTDVLLGRE
jgi:hypothetical protein